VTLKQRAVSSQSETVNNISKSLNRFKLGHFWNMFLYRNCDTYVW